MILMVEFNFGRPHIRAERNIAVRPDCFSSSISAVCSYIVINLK